MKTNTKLTLAAAALTGLLAGSASRAMASTVPARAGDSSSVRAKLLTGSHQAVGLDDTSKDDKHSCKGANACQGKGGCKTGDNGCKGKNTCKGKGGCKTSDDAGKM